MRNRRDTKPFLAAVARLPTRAGVVVQTARPALQLFVTARLVAKEERASVLPVRRLFGRRKRQATAVAPFAARPAKRPARQAVRLAKMASRRSALQPKLRLAFLQQAKPLA